MSCALLGTYKTVTQNLSGFHASTELLLDMVSRLVSGPDMARLVKLTLPNLTCMTHGQSRWIVLQNLGRRLAPGLLS